MPQHPRKASAKLVIPCQLAKEKTKKHKLFLSFTRFCAILTSTMPLLFGKSSKTFGFSRT
jgi:hypothetical protein